MKTPLTGFCLNRIPFFYKGIVEMCLFKEAAAAWLRLLDVKYEIIAGRRGKIHHILLDFAAADFPHLAGMQYAQDAAFNLNPNEYYGDKLVYALVSGKLDGTLIERSRNWLKIEGRLNAIIHLQRTLESKFAIAQFDRKSVRTGSKIDADYVIKNLDSGEIYFVFVDEDTEHRQYCKSAFAYNRVDYMQNQALLTVLKNTKITVTGEQTIYIHPNYIT